MKALLILNLILFSFLTVLLAISIVGLYVIFDTDEEGQMYWIEYIVDLYKDIKEW